MTRLLLALLGVLLACATVPRPSGSSSPLFERITLEQSGDGGITFGAAASDGAVRLTAALGVPHARFSVGPTRLVARPRAAWRSRCRSSHAGTSQEG